ncbi:solute carrier organic anion transporter family member 2B1 [Acipenser oxyrinchus oxyrinchus]|uniref:Solute carrier organic anion transporter family member 2B1 n=1 Tax=Acipenser oxyrinchus oxyrinchus TaxID=40147 RepID=A0AAD8DHU8_ACIOX|nr:solute carrier organic anion transporter family member 2B1 [Acipenser oxyrinchus oxyrinchus]
MTATSALKESSGEENTTRRCRKNPFYSIKVFLFCHGLLQLAQLLVSGYLKSTISTIEKRYGLSSQTSGMLTSFNEVGNTVLIVFVSFFGSRVHRPRFIGIGALIASLAGFLMASAHLITSPYEYDHSIANHQDNNTDICQLSPLTSQFSMKPSEGNAHEHKSILALMFIGQLLLGIGGVPIQPFGISYIDDYASERNSPLYIGLLFAITTTGPALAFMLGSAMLRFYVDIDKVSRDSIDITTSDPVGWELGGLVS